MKMKSMICGLFCAACLLTGSALAIDFSDVPADEWYTEAVDEMAERGIMSGVDDGIFAPEGTVDRGTVVTVLWRLAGEKKPVGQPFPDAAGTWYEAASAWCRDMGIAAGYEDGSFRGGQSVTRQELAVFLCNYARWRGDPLAEAPLERFDDADEVAEWAAESVSHAVGIGILKGDNLSCIAPQGKATRAALAVMLQRMLTPAAG